MYYWHFIKATREVPAHPSAPLSIRVCPWKNIPSEERERERETDKQRQRLRGTEPQRQIETDRHTERDTDTQRETQTHRDTDTQRETQTHRERHTKRSGLSTWVHELRRKNKLYSLPLRSSRFLTFELFFKLM